MAEPSDSLSLLYIYVDKPIEVSCYFSVSHGATEGWDGYSLGIQCRGVDLELQAKRFDGIKKNPQHHQSSKRKKKGEREKL